MCMAHCAVIFAIAQLSCFNAVCCTNLIVRCKPKNDKMSGGKQRTGKGSGSGKLWIVVERLEEMFVGNLDV